MKLFSLLRNSFLVIAVATTTASLGLSPVLASSTQLPITAPAPPPLNWQPCPEGAQPLRDCATLTVPLNYANLSEGTIDLPVTRAKATTQSQGVLIFNPGGPTIPAANRLMSTSQSRLIATFTPEIVDKFDIVSFNARGLTDGLGCFTSDTQKTYWQTTHLPKTTAEFATLLGLERQANQACQANNEPLVRHVDSASGVRDMEQLRRAMGVDQFSFYGMSYGTFFGHRYATLYPGKLKAMVLDAATDRGVSDPEWLYEQTRSYEVAWNDFKQWCQNTETCRLRGQNIDALFDQLMTTARATGIPAPNNPLQPDRPVNDWELNFALQATLVPGDITYAWTEEILVKATQNDASLAGLLYDNSTGARPDGTYNPGGTGRTITCIDTRWSQIWPNTNAVKIGAAAARQVSPHMGEVSLFQGATQCHGYPIAPVEAPPVTLNVPQGQPAFVVIGGTKDLTTPIKGSQHTAQQIPGSRLVVRDGYGHISIDKSRCVKTIANEYLVRGTLPANNTQCQTDPDLYFPQPVPVLSTAGVTATETRLPELFENTGR